jgi:putative transposase
MANTYTQIFIQIVFTVKGRHPLLAKEWRANVFKYISGIITEKGHKAIIVNGVSNHVHCFIGMKPSMSISDLARDIKNNSSKFINSQGFLNQNFEWQVGYGAFSYSNSEVNRLYNYILNQESHHSDISFEEEYKALLKRFNVEYKEEYLFG